MPHDTLAHPTLRCSLRGKASAATVQFRNLKYASIPGRWEDSVPNDALGTGVENVIDATIFGPSCSHKRGAQAWDLTLVGNVHMPLQAGHRAKEEDMDEFDCLNINVTVPRLDASQDRDATSKGLPVFVWVHGGGLSMGSNSWPQYDLTRFVERSVEIGKPVIGVAMNYRVGILGFLASKELGIDGNFGYKDQVLAFKWIKKHIAGFGGDPSNITAAGESAGGISLSTLLYADVGDEGLFERVVIMSGEATLRKSRNKAWHEEMYFDQLKMLGLDKMGVRDRTKKLREVSTDELAKLPMAQHYCACIDGKFLKKDITARLLSDGTQKEGHPDWCKEFVVGDTAHDVSIFLFANTRTDRNRRERFSKHAFLTTLIAFLSSNLSVPNISPPQRHPPSSPHTSSPLPPLHNNRSTSYNSHLNFVSTSLPSLSPRAGIPAPHAATTAATTSMLRTP
jgi:carboxylesterase type B